MAAFDISVMWANISIFFWLVMGLFWKSALFRVCIYAFVENFYILAIVGHFGICATVGNFIVSCLFQEYLESFPLFQQCFMLLSGLSGIVPLLGAYTAICHQRVSFFYSIFRYCRDYLRILCHYPDNLRICHYKKFVIFCFY